MTAIHYTQVTIDVPKSLLDAVDRYAAKLPDGPDRSAVLYLAVVEGLIHLLSGQHLRSLTQAGADLLVGGE